MWGVLGGGFGLYGYLPALARHSRGKVLLLQRYCSVIEARPDLMDYLEAAEFCEDESELMSRADSLVMARRPEDTLGLLDRIAASGQLQTVILEKPVGRTPDEGADVIDRLERTGKAFDAAFLFRHAPWAQAWRVAITRRRGPEVATLRWRFHAHHYRNDLINWKRMHDSGGGALRFFGIHVIALLAEWGFEQVSDSRVIIDDRGGVSGWQARFVSERMAPVLVDLDSRAISSEFALTAGGGYCHRAEDPFSQPGSLQAAASGDRRVSYLLALLGGRRETVSESAARLRDINRLWHAVEAATESIHRVCNP